MGYLSAGQQRQPVCRLTFPGGYHSFTENIRFKGNGTTITAPCCFVRKLLLGVITTTFKTAAGGFPPWLVPPDRVCLLSRHFSSGLPAARSGVEPGPWAVPQAGTHDGSSHQTPTRGRDAPGFCTGSSETHRPAGGTRGASATRPRALPALPPEAPPGLVGLPPAVGALPPRHHPPEPYRPRTPGLCGGERGTRDDDETVWKQRQKDLFIVSYSILLWY